MGASHPARGRATVVDGRRAARPPASAPVRASRYRWAPTAAAVGESPGAGTPSGTRPRPSDPPPARSPFRPRGQPAATAATPPARPHRPAHRAPFTPADGEASGDTNGNGETKAPFKPAHIRDNAFLVEEAFNQQPGGVQHIFSW